MAYTAGIQEFTMIDEIARQEELNRIINKQGALPKQFTPTTKQVPINVPSTSRPAMPYTPPTNALTEEQKILAQFKKARIPSERLLAAEEASAPVAAAKGGKFTRAMGALKKGFSTKAMFADMASEATGSYLKKDIPAEMQTHVPGEYNADRLASIAGGFGTVAPGWGRALLTAPALAGLAAKLGYESTGQGVSAEQTADEIRRMNEASARAKAARPAKASSSGALRQATPDELKDFILANQGPDDINGSGKLISPAIERTANTRDKLYDKFLANQDAIEQQANLMAQSHANQYSGGADFLAARDRIGALQGINKELGTALGIETPYATAAMEQDRLNAMYPSALKKSQAETEETQANTGYKKKQIEGYDSSLITERLKAMQQAVPPQLQASYDAWKELAKAGNFAEADNMAKALYQSSGGKVQLPLTGTETPK